jgi:hypothetical protein
MTVSFLFPPFDAMHTIRTIDTSDMTNDPIGNPASSPATEVTEPRSKRNTKAIGDMSELEVAVALARAGHIVSKPLGDSYRYDLIFDDGEKLYRVQVKTGRLYGGSIRFAASSSHFHRGGVSARTYHGQVDFIGVFCPQTGHVYMVPESEFGNSKMHLRVTPTGNGQDKHIRWASRYRLA